MAVALLFPQPAAAEDACKDDRQKLGWEHYTIARYALAHLDQRLPVTHAYRSVRTNCLEFWLINESQDAEEQVDVENRLFTLEGIVFYRDATGLQRSQRFAIRILTDAKITTAEVKSLYLEPR